MSALRTLLRALAFVVLASAGFAHSATINVTTTAMTIDGTDGQCSLPEALQAAETNLAVGECAAGTGDDTIVLVPGTYTATTFTNHPTMGPTAAVITENLEIIGNGATIVRDGGAPNFRIFGAITPGIALTLRDLVLQGGNATDAVTTFGSTGGAVFAALGVLQLDRVRMLGNTATGAGAVASGGFLNIQTSLFAGNTGAFTIQVEGGTLNMVNSTLGGNSGISADLFVNSSDAFNLRHNSFAGLVQLEDTAGASDLTGNLMMGGCNGVNITGTFTVGANAAPAGTCVAATITDVSSVQALGNYGGATLTAGIRLPSALADGNPDCTTRSSGLNSLFPSGVAISIDQRGFTRPAGACDVGAFEAARYTPNTLPNGVVGQAYDSGAITIDGAPAFASINGAPMPAGLAVVPNLAAGTFNVTGTPTAAGSTDILFTATDGNGMVSLHGMTLLVIGPPGAPTITSTATGNGSADISFTPPASDGGSPITGYQVKCNSGETSASSLTSPITISLPNGATYDCQVYATNAAGEGPPSNNANIVLAPTTVQAISNSDANPNPGPTVRFFVQFTRAVTGVDAADFTLTTTGTIAGASITGITGSGTDYVVTVNTGTGNGTIRLDVVDNDTIVDASGAPLGGTGAGNGNFNTGFTYSIVGVPGAPTITSITPGNGQATIAFTPPASDGGSPITGYRASCTPGPVVSGSSATSPITINLANGATYSCVVIATNANGDGPPSTAQGVTLPATTVASIVRASANPNGGPSVAFTVTFTNPVTGVDAADFALTTTGVTGAAVTGVSGSGTTYTVTVGTGTGQGTIRLDVVDNDTITDGSAPLGGTGAGNGNFTAGQVYTITSVPGAPIITSATPGSGQATIAFTPPPSDGGSPITGYRVSCTPGPVVSASSATSPITIALTNGTTYSCVVIATNANGDGPPSAPASVAMGVTGVTSIVRASANPTGAASVNFTVTFSQPVTGVDAGDFTLTTTGVTGAAITGVTGSGTTYTVAVSTGSGAGTIRLDLVDNDSINDGSAPLGGAGAGNGNFNTGESYTVDRTAPTVASSNRVGAATVSGGAPQQFTVTFSEAVTGVDAADFTVTATGTAAATVTGVIGSGTTYTVTVNITTGGTSGGTVRLDVTDNDSIVDALGNPLGGTGAGNGSFTTGQSYTVSSAVTQTFSGTSATGSGTITVTMSGGGASCTFQNPQFIPVEGHPRSPPAGSAPPGVTFPHGLFDFSLINCTPGSTVTITITYPSSVDGMTYWKYGPTPTAPLPHWYVMPATLAGNVATLSITDGGLGDDDLTANGTIVDQGGPGTGPGASSATPIPTMSEWAMILMSLLLFGMAAGPLRRRVG